MSDSALVIGGTRFIGRHTVEDLLEHDYEVTIFNRGNHENPFADREGVEQIEGDRREDQDLRAAALSARPDIVIDCVAYYPEDVDVAVDIFADVDGYVYISSGDAYGEEWIPKREGATPMRPCTEEQAVDDSDETYGNRKAEGDRIVQRAAEEGVNAMSVRPCIVYGPYDYTGRMDYWLDRVDTHDRIVVPGDGQNLWHRAYAPDVGSALRTVAEEGEPGKFYNVGDQRAVTLEEMLDLVADAMDTDLEVVTAGERELAAAGLEPEDFILYREYPHMLDTSTLADLGWESTPPADAMARTVEEHRDSDRDGSEYDPGREAEEAVLDVLDTL
ncbi:NAD-dependent epimerase/dehydratase family protein [Halolamina sp.]|jgi:nucleoside-diphosphate-sugar epimerase|uniref:NAD-dependent epimerase/dehydratase family protein n=1 Tax=Halolamina sp. TaxID=1940283 RepID=UPI000223BAE2|nr:NAD-dependent epimerase/dehydratase [halophilic archaeon DL31]